MMLELLQNDRPQYFAIIISVIVSIILHELAHGWVAVKCGDRTPIETGHMSTLNPLVHMGPMSLMLLAVVGFAFGAMPIDPTRLRGKYAESLVAIAGPAMNLLLAILAIIAVGMWYRHGGYDPSINVQRNGMLLLQVTGMMNLALMLFNLLPIPPLDGSRVAANLFPAYRRFLEGELTRGIMIAIFFAMFFGGARYIFLAATYGYAHAVNIVAGFPVYDVRPA